MTDRNKENVTCPLGMECRRIERVIGGQLLKIDAIGDVDTLLEHYARGSGDAVDLIPYYAMLWPSAEAVAEYLVSHYESLEGFRVLELGCGLGLPSMVAAQMGARVLAVDFHPDCPEFLRRNLKLNGVTTVEVRLGDWRSLSDTGPFDLVLGSDLLYERENIESLSRAVVQLCSRKGHIVLGDPGRDHFQPAVNRICAAGFDKQVEVEGDVFVVSFERRETQPG